MVSGALLLGKVESYKDYFKKRASRILLPWLIWSTAFFFIDKGTSYFVVLMTRFWFIPLIVGLYAFTPTLRLFITKAKSRDLMYVLLIWFFIIISLPYLYSSTTFAVGIKGSIIEQVIQFSGYFLLGYYLANLKKIKNQIFLSLILIVAGILGSNILTMTYPPGPVDYLKYFDYVSPFVVATSIGVFLLAKNLFEKRIWRQEVVRKISDASFGIIFVHELFNLFFWHNDANPLFFMSNLTYVGFDFVRAAISFFCALIVVLIVRRMRFLNGILV